MQNNPKLAFKEFMDKLSYYMVNQTRLNAYQNRTRNRAARNDEVIALQHSDIQLYDNLFYQEGYRHENIHILRALFKSGLYDDVRGTNHRAKRTCKYCGRKTSYFCVTCSDIDNDILICLCNPATIDRDLCLLHHSEE